jgi:branched-subunit amino acid permease
MMRITIEGVLLFLLPFGAYAALAVLGPRLGLARRGPFGASTLGLVACGIGLIILALVALGVLGGRARGTYVPAHMEDGRLIPGRLQ